MFLWTQKTLNLNSRRPTSNFLFPDPFNYGKIIIFSVSFAGILCCAIFLLGKMMYHYEPYRKIILWKNNHKKILWKMMNHRSGNKTLLVGRLDTKQNRRGHMIIIIDDDCHI